LIEVFRAGHTAVRGFSKIAMVVLGSYASSSPDVANIVRNEKLILDAIDAITGDGSFTAKVNRDARTRTVSVTARGKELAHVLPIAGVLPMAGGAAAFLAMGKDAPMKSPKSIAPAPAKTTRPAVRTKSP
jgi:hypothetical protein